MAPTEPVSLISRWLLAPGREAEAWPILEQLAKTVQASEPDTLTYLVHAPFHAEPLPPSLPPSPPGTVLFFETYRSPQAFVAHVTGPTFTDFVAAHGDLFLQAGGKPYTTVEFLWRAAGFVRSGDEASSRAAVVPPAAAARLVNTHPAVMFEIVARDQAAMQAFYTTVFGWHYARGSGGFAYVHFPAGAPRLLGGIAQADAAMLGFEPGRNFYLLVDRLEPVLDAAIAAGASPLMPPSAVDGYRFAMFRDPEGNPVGLIEPFGQ